MLNTLVQQNLKEMFPSMNKSQTDYPTKQLQVLSFLMWW